MSYRIAPVIQLLEDYELVDLHHRVHAEWRRRYPAGDWPQAETNERRTELREQARTDYAATKRGDEEKGGG